MSKPNPGLHAATVLDRAVQEALGSAHLEIAKLRASNAVIAADNARLTAENAALREELAAKVEPELPLPAGKEGSNGARH